MQDDDLAETTSNHQEIWINNLALRNRKITEAILNADNTLAAKSVEGIGAHEMGHVISGKIRNGKSGLDIYKETVYNISGKKLSDDEALKLLKHHVSDYSVFISFKKNGTPKYDEIIPEILSIEMTSPTKYSTEFVRILKEACFYDKT